MFQVKDNAIGNLKYTSRSRAVVVDNNDPLKRGRIRVLSPVLGNTNWIPYLTSPGMFSVPDINAVVYLEADGGSYNHPVAWGNLNYGSDSDLKFPSTFQRVSPTNRGMYTPGGHLLEIDDGEDPTGTKRGFRFTGSQGTILHIKEEPADNSFTFKTINGTTLKIDGTSDAISLTAAFGDTFSVSAANGIQGSTPSGTILSMVNGTVALVAQDSMAFTTANGPLSINAGSGDLTESGNVISLDGTGGKLKLTNGTVALGTSGTELLNELLIVLKAFSDNAATLVSTSVGPGVLNPAVVTALTTFDANITAIKGSL